MASPAWPTLSALPRLDTSTHSVAIRGRPQTEDGHDVRLGQEARPFGFSSLASHAPAPAYIDQQDTAELSRPVAETSGIFANEPSHLYHGQPWIHDGDDDEDEDDNEDEDEDEDDDDGYGDDVMHSEKEVYDHDRYGGLPELSPPSFMRRPATAVSERLNRNNSSGSSVSPFSQPYHTLPATIPAATTAISQNPFTYGFEPFATEPPRPLNDIPIMSAINRGMDGPSHLRVETDWNPVTAQSMTVGHDAFVVPLKTRADHSDKMLVERENYPPRSFSTSGYPRMSSIASPPDVSSTDSSARSSRYWGSRQYNTGAPTLQPTAVRGLRGDVEKTLAFDSRVSRAVVVNPKAGLFEGQLVTLLTLSDSGPAAPSHSSHRSTSSRGSSASSANDDDIKLQNAYFSKNLPAIRRSVEAQVAPECIPGVWIVLEKMPLDSEGQVHRRRLQTWIQNVNDDLYRRIMSIESKGELRKPSTPFERSLSRAVSRVLRVEKDNIGMNMSFANLGGDSRAAEALAGYFQSQGIVMEARDILEASSLSQLATVTNPEATNTHDSEESASEMFDLSPMQHLYFHTPMGNDTTRRKTSDGDYRFNQSILLRIKQSISVEDLRLAVEAVVAHHKMLRARFRFSGGSWWQSIEPAIPTSYQFAHHNSTNTELESVVTKAHLSINIEHGPIFAAHHFHTKDGYQLLYLVAHHLVVDLKSWQVIADDIERFLIDRHLASGHSLTFKEWTLHQKHRVQTTTDVIGLSFELPERNWEYWGVKDTLNTYGSTVAFGFTLESEVTSVLEQANRELKTDSCDIFMSALLLSFAQTFRDRSAPILWNQEQRAAQDVNQDISSTVGWFTYLFPLVVDVSPTDDVFSISSRVKDARRAAAKTSLSHFTANLIDASSAESFSFSHCPLEIVFAYAGALGRLQSRNAVLEELDIPGKKMGSETADVGPSVGRIAIFEVSVWMEEGEAKLTFLHHRDSKHRDEIQTWIRNYERVLRQSISRLKDYAPGLSMSDVPYLGVTPEGLNRLNREILPELNLSTSNIENVFPATAYQQCVLVHESLLPGSSLAEVTYELSTVGRALDTPRICNAWNHVTNSHPAMRTFFSPSVLKEGLYDQIILRNHSPKMLFIESEEIEGPMAAIGRVPPLLFKDGWHRLIVCQTMGKAYLRLEVSQAICDIASIAILFDELQQVYFNGIDTTATIVSFPEYHERLKLSQSSSQFWKDKLLNVQPTHFPRLTSGIADTTKWQTTQIDLQIPLQRLHDFARFYKVDKSTILRVAWGILLRTYLGTQDVCFGYRTSGRDLPIAGLESAVGPFSRVLVCRMRVLAQQTIVQLLRDAQVEHQKALQYQHVPMSVIEHELDTKGKRLFNTCVSFGYEDMAGQSHPKNKFLHTSSIQASEYDINVDFSTRNGGLTVVLGHRIFANQQAITVGHVLGKAVETILESPSATVKESDLFTINDHNQILAWNSMPQIDVQNEHIPALIAAQAHRNPDIEAVCGFDGSLSYAELYKYSMGLSRYMLNLGVRHQMPVPVVADKSRWTIVAMLSVLMMGGVLIPIDAETTDIFPCVVQAVQRGLVLASDSVRGYFERSGCRTLAINEQNITSLYVQAVELRAPVPTKPHDVACILLGLTSSNHCKAVSYSHGALATACTGQGTTLRINPSSRVMQLSCYGVDVSLSEIFTTLVNGGCVCIPKSSERVVGFTAAAQRMRVNWTHLTPPLSRKINPEALPDIAVVCFRDTQLDVEVYSQWQGKAKVILVYGSAEACPLGLSATELTGSSILPSFGNPFCGNFWIVSPEDHNRLMPVGAVGELVIGGPTLANASWLDLVNLDIELLIKQSSDRAQSLLEHSASHLLKTGRMVRYREQGEIEFVTPEVERGEDKGRKPFSISDVESQIRRCIDREVDVMVEKVVFKDTSSTPILKVFVELGDDFIEPPQGITHIDNATRQRLFYFKQTVNSALGEATLGIPLAYIPVRRLPLTPSLRLDRRSLQRLTAGLSRQQLLGLCECENKHSIQVIDSKESLSLTQEEHQMRALWAQVLGIEDRSSISANDGFVTLGGDIVSGHKLVVMCRQRGIDVSIVDILRNKTLSELCKGLAPFQIPIATSVQGVPTSSNGLMPATGPKLSSDRSVIEDVAEASSLQTMFVESAMLQARGNVSYFLLTATGYLDWHKLENACFMLTKAHPILRTAFVSQNRQLYQTVLGSYRPEFLRYQCKGWRLPNIATRLIKREQRQPIDFRRPITKFHFLDAGRNSILIMQLSRAQYDDLSIPILVRDLGRFYQQTGPVTPSTGFCEVIRAVRSTYASEATEYWRSLLEGASITQVFSQPSLPVANSSPKMLQQKVTISSLQNFDIPFEAILKGAWSIVLSNLSGTDDVVFGQMVEGRHLSLANGQTISSVVGPKGNVIPVRIKVPDFPVAPIEYFRNIQSQYVASIPYENLQTADVIHNCTAWPSWTRFSTVVHHQRQTERYKSLNFSIGEATCTLEMMGLSHEDSDFFVQTIGPNKNDVEISISFCEKKIQPPFAEEVLRMLCSTISVLTTDAVMNSMMLKGLNDGYKIPRIPLQTPNKSQSNVPSTVLSNVDPNHARAVHSVVSAAWDAVLGTQSLQVADIRSVPFYEIWGAHMPAAELARYYTQKIPRFPGLEQRVYTTEEIIENPTMISQYELIIAKQQETQLKHRPSFLRRNPSRTYSNRG